MRPNYCRSSALPLVIWVLAGVAGLSWARSLSGADPDEIPESIRDIPRKRIAWQLSYIHPAFHNDLAKAEEKRFRGLLADRDQKAWGRRVAEAEQAEQRTSFLAEYFAWSGAAIIEPIEGIGPDPLPTKGKLHLLAFRPVETVKGTPYPEKFRNTVYIIVRGIVPQKHNPYKVFFSKSYRGFTGPQIEQLVQALREKW